MRRAGFVLRTHTAHLPKSAKKTGSLKFISPPVKIYTSRNINSMIIIQFILKKYKLCKSL